MGVGEGIRRGYGFESQGVGRETLEVNRCGVDHKSKVMEELVGRTGQSAGGGEREMGGNKKVGQVLG